MGLTRPKLRQVITQTTKLDDPIIEINSALGDAQANANDIGIIFKRGSSGDNAAILWDRSAGEFILATTTATGDSSGDLTVSGYADLHVNSLVSAGLTFPSTDGTNGQVLATNGAGILSFATIPTEVNDLTAAVTWANVPDAYITQSSVVQHEGALTMDGGTF